MIITSSQNELAKKISSLTEKKYRKLYGEYLVEGVKPVKECILAGCEISKIVCTPQYAEEFPQATLFSESLFSRVSTEKTPQGVLALVKLPENKLASPSESCILLDGLQDSGNVGTIIRTANAAGYKRIYCVNCADPFSPKAVRASMSGVFFVDIVQGERAEILRLLEGTDMIAADMRGENIFSFVPPKKYCLCIGNEGNGISEEVFKACNYKISIPMNATCESLNAAVSAGIAMYQLKFKSEV